MKKNKWFTPLTVLLALAVIVVLMNIIPGFKWFLDFAAEWFMDAGINILLWILGIAVVMFVSYWVASVWNYGKKHPILKLFYFLCGAVLAACVNIGIWAARVEIRFPDNPNMMENYFGIGGITIFAFTLLYFVFLSTVPTTNK